MKKNYLITTFLLLCIHATYGQHYKFEKQNESYTPLSNPKLLFTESWETIDSPPIIKLPFTFTLFNRTMDELQFAGGTIVNLLEQPDQILLSGFLITPDLIDIASLYPNATTQTQVSTQVDGSVGNRIFKIQVSDAGSEYELTSKNSLDMRVSFQVWLYEATHVVSFHYGANTVTDLGDFSESEVMICGLIEQDYLLGKDQEVISFTEKSSVLSGMSNDPALKTDSKKPVFLITYPDEGMVYTFTPTTLSTVKNEITSLSIHPNPTEGILNIAGNIDPATFYSILDMTGKKVQEGKIAGGNIDVTKLSKGIYMLKLGNNRQILKFIKK
ncbi:T9SS type A sorting domain-containing protein [Flavobacterium sp. HSC-61S13]|uniref:T9SS type A sorting domain-containing protein n=1 Tax=Flavobacterium sp. HSC-61S13 TaxID=2910963 RepID=UPI0020A21497|nr:T9SS type A sorting domain-containing protein [Flavobacterium sp. HSC-61S13]MCP1996696.1 hypothetical protein [Flavobacterium sp. HSC-61S13]